MNKYQVIAPALSTEIGQDRRLRIQGAVLGGGIPLLPSVAYWFPGWGAVAAIACWGAVVGAVAGWRYADPSVTTPSPSRLAFRVGVKAAEIGALGVGAAYWVALVVLTGNVGAAIWLGAIAVAVGVVVGSLFTVPIALVSIIALRRTIGHRPTADAIALGLVAACVIIVGAITIDLAHGGPWYLAAKPQLAAITFESFPWLA
jgi:hypothetical protein